MKNTSQLNRITENLIYFITSIWISLHEQDTKLTNLNHITILVSSLVKLWFFPIVELNENMAEELLAALEAIRTRRPQDIDITVIKKHFIRPVTFTQRAFIFVSFIFACGRSIRRSFEMRSFEMRSFEMGSFEIRSFKVWRRKVKCGFISWGRSGFVRRRFVAWILMDWSFNRSVFITGHLVDRSLVDWCFVDRSFVDRSFVDRCRINTSDSITINWNWRRY